MSTFFTVLSALLCLAVAGYTFVLLAKVSVCGMRPTFRLLLTAVAFVAGISLLGICHAFERHGSLTTFEACWYPVAGWACAIAMCGALIGSWKLHCRYPPRCRNFS